MVNRVVLVGRMTKDPELRRTASGKAVTSFSLALDRGFNSEEADFIPCVVWNKVAENVEKYCSKGSLVSVEGKLRSRIFDNAQGQRVFIIEVLCDGVRFLDTKNTNSSKENYSSSVDSAEEIDIEKELGQSLGFNLQEDDIHF